MASAVISNFAFAIRKAKRVECTDPAWMETVKGMELLLPALNRARQHGVAPTSQRPRSGIPH
eukprot:2823134-Prorocentrum_lima.AAC.1